MSREYALLAAAAESFQSIVEMAGEVARATEIVCKALKSGNRIFFCGNGGSAADSQHLAAELMGRYLVDRNPMAALALTVDTSALTAIGNDYGFDDVFARQIRGLGRPDDVLVGLSTSGNSANVVKALGVARQLGLVTIGMTGARDSAMTPLCDLSIQVPSTHTPRIQEMHIALGHTICELVESEFL